MIHPIEQLNWKENEKYGDRESEVEMRARKRLSDLATIASSVVERGTLNEGSSSLLDIEYLGALPEVFELTAHLSGAVNEFDRMSAGAKWTDRNLFEDRPELLEKIPDAIGQLVTISSSLREKLRDLRIMNWNRNASGADEIDGSLALAMQSITAARATSDEILGGIANLRESSSEFEEYLRYFGLREDPSKALKDNISKVLCQFVAVTGELETINQKFVPFGDLCVFGCDPGLAKGLLRFSSLAKAAKIDLLNPAELILALRDSERCGEIVSACQITEILDTLSTRKKIQPDILEAIASAARSSAEVLAWRAASLDVANERSNSDRCPLNTGFSPEPPNVGRDYRLDATICNLLLIALHAEKLRNDAPPA